MRKIERLMGKEEYTNERKKIDNESESEQDNIIDSFAKKIIYAFMDFSVPFFSFDCRTAKNTHSQHFKPRRRQPFLVV